MSRNRSARLFRRLIYLAIIAAGAYWLWRVIPPETWKVLHDTYVAPGRETTG